MKRARLGDDFDVLAAALNCGDTAEKLTGVDGWIFFGEGVATRGESDAIALGPFARDTMDERSAAEKKENNFAAARVGGCVGADGKKIAGIDRRNHAAAVRDETNFAETVKDFGGEVEPRVMHRCGEPRGRRTHLRRGVILSGAIRLNFRNRFERRFWRRFSRRSGSSRGRGSVARSQEFLRLKRHCA